MLRNTKNSYGLISKLFHWILALGVFGLFALGLWMVELNYYSPYYRTAPDLHRSLGMLLVALMVIRWVWLKLNAKPAPLPSHSKLEISLANVMHKLFYILVIALGISGYLITTAQGQPISFFNLFDIPSIIQMNNLEDTAGKVHFYLAWGLIILSAIHVLGALKHHFLDKDDTLKRIIK